MELDGQVALVTGAGRGIGRAIALELAGLGASISVAELNAAAAEQTAAEVTLAGRPALAVRADVTRADDRTAMVDATLKTFGRIDILVNNAGIYRSATPLEITEDHWDAVLGVNAKAVLFCAQAVLPTMLAARRGIIINIASMAGKVASATALPYAVSKAAVISLTRSLAAAYAGDGIRVNCVCPGFVDTEMWAQIDREVGVARLGKQPGEYLRERVATSATRTWCATGRCRQRGGLPGDRQSGLPDGSGDQRHWRADHALTRGRRKRTTLRAKRSLVTAGARDTVDLPERGVTNARDATRRTPPTYLRRGHQP